MEGIEYIFHHSFEGYFVDKITKAVKDYETPLTSIINFVITLIDGLPNPEQLAQSAWTFIQQIAKSISDNWELIAIGLGFGIIAFLLAKAKIDFDAIITALWGVLESVASIILAFIIGSFATDYLASLATPVCATGIGNYEGADLDEDGDGLSLEAEKQFGTSSTDSDTDNDVLPDYQEYMCDLDGTIPYDYGSTSLVSSSTPIGSGQTTTSSSLSISVDSDESNCLTAYQKVNSGSYDFSLRYIPSTPGYFPDVNLYLDIGTNYFRVYGGRYYSYTDENGVTHINFVELPNYFSFQIERLETVGGGDLPLPLPSQR